MPTHLTDHPLLARASIRARPRQFASAASAMDLGLPDPLLDRSVPIHVAKYLAGADEMRLYSEVKAGTPPLAKPSPSGQNRISLRTLAERGFIITEDTVAAAERLSQQSGNVVPGPDQVRSPLHVAARQWVEAGFSVFALQPDTKQPFLGTQGFKDATTDTAIIDTWWAEHPNANIGVVPASAGALVVDADPGSDVAALNLPDTPAVITPRGGRHFYFRSDETFGNGSPWDCIDIRSANGYVLVPPSIVNGKTYRRSDGLSGPIEPWECAQLPDHIAKALQDHATQQSTIDYGSFDWGQRRKPQDAQEPFIDDTITRELNKHGDRSAVAFTLVNKLIRRNYSAEEICDTLMHYDGTPVMAHYGDPAHEDRVRKDIVRAFQKPAPRRPLPSEVFTVSNSGPTAEPIPRRTIRVIGGSLPSDVADAEAALVEQNIGIFQRGSVIQRLANMRVKVRDGVVVNELGLAQIGTPEMVEHLTSAADWQRYDARSPDWRQIDCPRVVAETLLAHVGRWDKLRTLTGIINAPTLRPDGTLLDKPGYDLNTGLLLDTRGVAFPAIPAQPSKDDARQALAIFDELIREFPFATPEARAVALAAFLTACIRRTLPTAPIFGIDGTGAGSGKGLLVDTVSVVGIGREAAPITAGAGEEELEKRIGALMLRDDPVIAIDNLATPLDSAFLCSVLTQETAAVRILGQSKSPTLPTNCMFFASGNGLAFVGDLGRRAVTCLIDPKTERPSEAKHTFNPVDRARCDRPQYVAAALTVLRAYQVAGRPAQRGRELGSYDVWCRTVRDALLWLGEADCVKTVTYAADDPDRERFAAVVLAWERVIGRGVGVTLKKAVELARDAASTQPELLDALREVAPPKDHFNAGIDTDRLGKWLRSKKLQVIHGHRFQIQGQTEGMTRWVLEQVHP